MEKAALRWDSYILNTANFVHMKQFPPFYLPIIWNKLNYKLKLESKLSIFKKELLNQLLARYHS